MNKLTNLKTKYAIDYFGSVQKLANALGVSRYAIYQWGLYVPSSRAYQLEVLTGKRLQAFNNDEDSDDEREAA